MIHLYDVSSNSLPLLRPVSQRKQGYTSESPRSVRRAGGFREYLGNIVAAVESNAPRTALQMDQEHPYGFFSPPNLAEMHVKPTLMPHTQAALVAL